MGKKDYTSWSRNDLIKEIDVLRRRKKYGLVWENKSEDVVEQCKKELPVLEEVKSKEIITDPDKPMNLLIEGDNYHALSVLNYTHKGKIDAIYADPPYNTGAKNWIYNNNYVDGNDAFRHGKWLSFMEKRLKLARSLLKGEGLIVVTVDDYEVATLTLLMNDIFGEENHLGTVIIKNNPQGRSSVSGFQISHEYALFYGRSQKAKIGRLPRTQEQIARYKESDSKGPFEWRNFRAQYSTESPKMKYPIFVKKDCSDFRLPKMKWNSEKQSFDLLEKPDGSEQISLPVDPNGRERTWKWSIETVKLVKNTEMGVRLDMNKIPSVFYKGRMADEWMLPYTIWDKSDYSASAMGTNLLASIIGTKKFDYPKSLYAVIDCLRVLSSNKDSTFLDFFAGSGTTGHAVLELNKKDRGNRKFILCTNNELNGQEKNLREQGLSEKEIQSHGICQAVTYPRIKKVIGGYTDVEGIPANLKYYKTVFVPAGLTDKNKVEITKKATEMLCIKEATFEKVEINEKYKIFKNKNKYTGIIFDHQLINDFKKRINKIDKKISVYIFSLGDDTFDQEFADIKEKVTLSPIPEAILRVYRRIFK